MPVAIARRLLARCFHPPLQRRQIPLPEGGPSARRGGRRGAWRPAAARSGWRAGGRPRPARAAASRRSAPGRDCPAAGRTRSAGAAEDAVVGVERAGGLDGEIEAVVADLAGGADGLGLGGFDLLAGLGENRSGSWSRQATWSSQACRLSSSITAMGRPAGSAAAALAAARTAKSPDSRLTTSASRRPTRSPARR